MINRGYEDPWRHPHNLSLALTDLASRPYENLLRSFYKIGTIAQVVDSKAYTKRKSSGDSRPPSTEPPEVPNMKRITKTIIDLTPE